MSNSPFEPEVLALLDEIRRSPQGSFLQIPRHRLAGYVGEAGETISPHGSYLSKAERHLVSVYREQAARVLLEGCILALKKDPEVFTTLKQDERLRARARNLAPYTDGEAEIRRNLDRLAADMEASAAELAVSSLRLAPCDLAFNALAVCYQREGWLRSSVRVLERFYECAASEYQRAQAFGNIARAHALRGDFPTAFELLLRACRLGEKRCQFAAWGMAAAMQAGNDEGALECARLLEATPDTSNYPAVVSGIRHGLRKKSWTPTPESRHVIARISGTLSERSGAICDSFS